MEEDEKLTNIKVTLPSRKVSTMLPLGTKIISNQGGWITWYRRDSNLIHISTCTQENFECQNETSTITLFERELRVLVQRLHLK